MFKNNSRSAIKFSLLAGLIFLAACGGGGSGSPTTTSASTPSATVPSSPAAPVVLAGNNVAALTVDSGPVENTTGNSFNQLYTDVTICQAGTATCQTIDHVLVDTGSVGLRLLSSVISPALNLPKVAAASGFPLLDCVRFVDNSFAWGSVVNADIKMGGKTAGNTPVQVIADPSFTALQSACSTGTPISTIASLGAKGIIGIGILKEDCGAQCENVTANGVYFTCTTVACTSASPTTLSIAKQIKNPIPLFASDNNGFLIDLPAVNSAGEVSISGSLVFGIGTQANNQTGSVSVLKVPTTGLFSTTLDGQIYSKSFIDTGSNGIYFDSAKIATCSNGFYCPPSTVNFSATQVGDNSVPHLVNFSVDNAAAVFSQANAGPSSSLIKRVLPNISAPIGNSKIFDWGLPFYYGKRIFTSIEGQPSPVGTGPFHAF